MLKKGNLLTTSQFVSISVEITDLSCVVPLGLKHTQLYIISVKCYILGQKKIFQFLDNTYINVLIFLESSSKWTNK